MDRPPVHSSTTGWWLAWLGGVLGGPGLGFGLVALMGDSSDAALPALLLSLLTGLGLHIVASVKLASRIAAARLDANRRNATGGLVVGLLLGGWAAMFAIFFVGCLATLMKGIGR